MEKILISACLVGDKVRYDGHGNYTPKTKDLLEKYELVPFCPEVEGGLKTPRKPAEKVNGRIINTDKKDVTKYYERGAELALNICKYLNIKIAVLKENSPSCGVSKIHDGTFSGKKIEGSGTTTELLRSHGIKVISEEEIDSIL